MKETANSGYIDIALKSLKSTTTVWVTALPRFSAITCYVEAQRKLVGNLEAAISTLTAEIVELRKAVSERMESTDDSKSSTESWATVARRGGRQTTLKHANGTNSHSFRANSTGSISSSNVAISASSNVYRSS